MGVRGFSRRQILAGIPGAVVLAAGVSCGGDDDDDSGSTPTQGASATSPAGAGASPTTPSATRLIPASPTDMGAPAVTPASVSTAANPSTEQSIVGPYKDFGTTAKWGEYPRTIKHAMGEAKFTKQPVRIVCLDSGEMDAAVTLGVKPVGVLDYDPKFIPSYLIDGIKDAKTLGTLAEPNIEAIAALQPDLIITTKVRHEKIYDRLNAIAPAVFGISTGVAWRQNFSLFAQAMGLEEKAAQTVAKYEARVKAMNAKLPNPRPTVSVVRITASNLRYYQRANYSGTLLTDLGFQRPPSQNVDDFALLNQSMETLGQYGNGDWIVLSPTEGPDGNFAKQVLASPLWQSLDSVKKNQYTIVSDDVWMAGIGYNAANVIHDQIAAYFKIQA